MHVYNHLQIINITVLLGFYSGLPSVSHQRAWIYPWCAFASNHKILLGSKVIQVQPLIMGRWNVHDNRKYRWILIAQFFFPQTILNCCHKVAVIYMIKANTMIFYPFMRETWYNLMVRHSRPRTASELKHTNEKTYHGIRRWTTTDKRLTGIPKYLYLILEFLAVFWHIPAITHR